MKNFSLKKIGVFFSLLFILHSNLFANSLILNDDNLLDKRAKSKILEIGEEVKNRLGVDIYIYIKNDLKLEHGISTKEKINFIKDYETNLLKNFKDPFVLLTIILEQTHVNLYYSEELADIIDKDDILDDYVVPLLASKDKNSLPAKISAATLNGYSAIADSLSKAKNIELETNIGNEGKVSSTIWRVFIYFLVIGGLLAYTYAVLRKRK